MIPYSPMSPAEHAELEARYGRELEQREAEYLVRHRWEGEPPSVVETRKAIREYMELRESVRSVIDIKDFMECRCPIRPVEKEMQ